MNFLKKHNSLRFWILFTVALTAMSCGIYFFKYPNNFTIGGVSGMSIILAKWTANTFLTQSVWNAFLNIAMLVIAFFTLGKDVGIRTVYACLYMSAAIYILEVLGNKGAFDFMTHDVPIIDLVLAATIYGISGGIIFNIGATSGGTDVVALIIKKKFNRNIGVSLIIVDVLISLLTFFVFGWMTGVYAFIGMFLQSFTIDYAIRKINLCKNVMIIASPEEAEDIIHFIHNDIPRGATVYDAKGSYTGSDKKMLQTVLTQKQTLKLSDFLKKNHPSAFIIVTEIDKIIGQGFRYFQ